MSKLIPNLRTVSIITAVSFTLLFKTTFCSGKPVIREVTQDGYVVKLDLSSQVLSLNVPDDKFSGKAKGKVKSVEAEIYPDLKSIPESYLNFISAAMIAQKAKNFDDGLIAAVEYLCRKGGDKIKGKEKLLKDLLATLQKTRAKKEDVQANLKCQSLLYNALYLGGYNAKVSSKVKKIAKDSLKVFLDNELHSKPIGIYTWNDELKKIFQQDRYLQKPILAAKEVAMMKKVVLKDEKASSAYGTALSLVEQVNNPFPPEYCDFRSAAEKEGGKCTYCFIPPAMAHEAQLIKRLYGNRPIPDKFSLIDALIKEIQSGNISLKPKESSGWYDYKTYTLEPFVLPEKMMEAAKLAFGSNYKKELIKLFKAVLALTRETHIKNLEIALAGAAMPEPAIKIFPELTIEPIATYYLRLGKSYSFIRNVLQKYFSDSTLTQSYRPLPDGKSKSQENILDELKAVESLMYGLFSLTAEEIGLSVEGNLSDRSPEQMKEDMEKAQAWIKTFKEDKDLFVDNRMMVPVFYDIQRKKTKVWVVLGYSVKPLNINYEKQPTYTVIDPRGKKSKKKVEFHKENKKIAYPVSAEVYTDKILNREEFRSLCDSLKTQGAILKAIRSSKK